MPSRNKSAKACDPANLAPNHTAPLTDFSDIVLRLTLRTDFFTFAPAPGEAGSMTQARTRCPARAKQRFRYSCRGIILWQIGNADRRKIWFSRGNKVNRRAAEPGSKKGAAIAGGSKSKQGGVKQSGQEPLDVQK